MATQIKKSVCVYCGHKTGNNPSFLKAADDLGQLIAKLGHRLVYGGGDLGLMGAVSDGVMSAGGSVLGIIPKHLFELEVAKKDITDLIITENMHERKKIMVLNSDLFVLLPGGLGSLDEFFELITWRQIGLHAKPCIILNLDGYWDPLIALIDQQIEMGFVPVENRDYFILCTDLTDVETALKSHL